MVVSALAASIFIPLVVFFVGNSYSNSIKESEIKVRYVELAISILKSDFSEKNSELKDWAVKLLDNQSPVRLSEGAKSQLKNTPLRVEYDDGRVYNVYPATKTIDEKGNVHLDSKSERIK